MTTLILTDSDANALDVLVGSLRKMQPDWQILNMTSGCEVLKHIAANSVDCVISGVTLADMSGLELLTNVQAHSAQPIRFLMALNKDEHEALEHARTNHRVIDNTTIEEFVSTIETPLRLSELLNSEAVEKCMGQVHSLPSLPDVYQKMVAELASPQSSLLYVAKLIETDVGLSAIVLKIANSAFYGLNQRVESVSQGVALLGAHLIKNITLTAKVFTQFEGGKLEMNKLRQLNDQANKTGALANHLARLARVPKAVVDHTQVAGMLGNIGQLIAMTKTTTDAASDTDIPDELMGAYLLKQWLMPDAIVEAVALQYEPHSASNATITPVLILQAIRYLEEHLPDVTNAEQYQAAQEYLENIIRKDLAGNWLEAYRDLQLLTSHNDHDESHAA